MDTKCKKEPGNSDETDVENENETETNDEDKTKGLPIDRGWAWVVLAGAVFYLFLFGGIRKNFGIFFVAFQTRYQSSASMTSLLSTVQSIVRSIAVLIVMTLGLHVMSNRTSVMIGSLFLTVSNVITAYSRDIQVLFFSFGFLEPIGICMIHPPVLAILAEYFNKRRGMANSLAFCGASIGGLVFAPIITSLFEYYGYTATLMIVAGMFFNIMITGMLLRPIKSFQIHTQYKTHNDKVDECEPMIKGDKACINEDLTPYSSNQKMNIDGQGRNGVQQELQKDNADVNDQREVNNTESKYMTNQALKAKKDHLPHVVIRTNSCDNEKHTPSKYTDSPLLPRQRRRTCSTGRQRTFTETSPRSSLNRSLVALYASVDDIGGSIGDMAQLNTKPDTHDEHATSRNETYDSKRKSHMTSAKNAIIKIFKIMFDMSLFKKPLFPFFLCMAFLAFGGCIITGVFVAPHARDLGLTSGQIGILMSVIAGGDFTARLTLAFVSDKNFVRPTTILATAMAIIGVVEHFVRFFTTFQAMIGFCIVIGLTCGLYNAMYGVILIDYLTLPKYKSTLGFTFMCHGIGTAILFPIAGTIRDTTGSYVNTYHLLGTILLVGAFLMAMIPYVYKWQTKDEPTKDEETVDV